MSAEIKYDKSHHAGPDANARIKNRLRNSGGDQADTITKLGDGPTRAITNTYHSGHFVQPNTAAQETGPQEQAHRGAASTQYFTGRKSGDE
jgi:hypothetical protein